MKQRALIIENRCIYDGSWAEGVFYALRSLEKKTDYALIIYKELQEPVLKMLQDQSIILRSFDDMDYIDTRDSVYLGLDNSLPPFKARFLNMGKLNWEEALSLLTCEDPQYVPRTCSLRRQTKETDITIDLNLDGRAQSSISTGIGFFDHMMAQVSKHSHIDASLTCNGDLNVDMHHSVEDVALCLGQAVLQALGDKRGINRYSSSTVVMDEVESTCSMDFSSRAYLSLKGKFSYPYIGDFPTELVEHFFRSFCQSSGCTMHLSFSKGNSHHQSEALFKAFGRALGMAVKRNGTNILPSTKGVL